MDIQFAKSLLAVLSDGINPFTGEPLSEGDACTNPDMVRALYTVIHELDRLDAQAKLMPVNRGMTWTADEEERLVKEYHNGDSFKQIAQAHGRSVTSITARLFELGEVSDPKYNYKKKIGEDDSDFPNQWKPWKKDEDEQLVIEFNNGLSGIQMAKAHGRSVRSIAARLVRLGQISERKDLK